jgi:hypothetical protein
MPLSALACHDSVACPRRASRVSDTYRNVLLIGHRRWRSSHGPLFGLSACVSHSGVSSVLSRGLATRSDSAFPIRDPRVHASVGSPPRVRPRRSPTGSLPARRIANSRLASRVAFRAACIPGRLTLHSRSYKMCIRISE